MHARTAAATVLLAAGLALTACSSSSDNKSPTPASTSAPSPTFSTEADYIRACTRAIIAAPDDPMPGACTALRSDDFDTALLAAQRSGKTGGAGIDSCKAAIREQYEPGTAILTGAPTTPPECAGLSADELSQIVTDVIAENTGG
jgi:hypothetical protein